MLSGTHLFYMVTWSPGPPGPPGLHAPPGPYGLQGHLVYMLHLVHMVYTIHGPHGYLVYMLHLVTWSPVPGEHSFQLYLLKSKTPKIRTKRSQLVLY